jgi:SAM-dependent methyltransferase
MKLTPGWLLNEYLNFMHFNIHKAMMCNKLKRLTPTIKGSWMDIGAGDQPYREYFTGADEYLTTNTKRHYSNDDFEKLKTQTTFWIEDGKALPVPDHSMDGVACFQVLSVIDSPGEFFREISRVLKPGGKLLLTTDFIYPVWSYEDRYRHTSYNLMKLAENNGFSNPLVESFGGFGSTLYALFMRYVRSFPDIWKRKKMLPKLISAIPYLLLLLLLPLVCLKGIIIYFIEKNSTTNTSFTFNMMLTAEKK